jgi:hypothetical protein
MNKPIQHLANQCFVIDTHGKIYANEHMIGKFAKLIVQECIIQCEKNKDHEWLASGSRLCQALKNIYEIWAGSEGIPVPETAVEAYLLRLIEQMRDEASKALAEQEQEPFAWMFEDDYQRMKTSETCCEVYSVKVCSPERGKTEIALFTAPPQRKWVGLTDEEVTQTAVANQSSYQFARAIEEKLKEKNHDRA